MENFQNLLFVVTVVLVLWALYVYFRPPIITPLDADTLRNMERLRSMDCKEPWNQ